MRNSRRARLNQAEQGAAFLGEKSPRGVGQNHFASNNSLGDSGNSSRIAAVAISVRMGDGGTTVRNAAEAVNAVSTGGSGPSARSVTAVVSVIGGSPCKFEGTTQLAKKNNSSIESALMGCMGFLVC